MAATRPAAATGLFASLRGLLATSLGLLRTRAELLIVEIEEEKLRLFATLLLGLLCCFFLGVGLLLLVIFLTVVFWESHRLLVLGLSCGLFLLLGILALQALKQQLQRGSQLFKSSLQELQQDIEQLQTDPDSLESRHAR